MHGKSRPKAMMNVEADLWDAASREAAKWERRFALWFWCILLCAATLLVSTCAAVGERGSVAGQWLAKRLPVMHARICHRPIDYRAIILDQGVYELYGSYDLQYWKRVDDLVATTARFTEVDILIWDDPSAHGWWGLTTRTEPLRFFWFAWRNGEPEPPDLAMYGRIREDIIADLCASYPAECANYQAILAAGAVSMQGTNLQYIESFALHRVQWSGYAHNVATIVALILLPFAAVRVRTAGRLASGWRRMRRSMTCPVCDYNLRGLPSSRCPECGTEFRSTT